MFAIESPTYQYKTLPQKPRITEYIHVFCPRGQLKRLKFGPAKFSALRFIQATT